MLPRFRLLSITIVCLPLFLACPSTQDSPQSTGTATAPSETPDAKTVVAEMHGKNITLGELDTWIKEDLFARSVTSRGPTQAYEARSEALERMLSKKLLDQEQQTLGLSAEKLFEQETAKAAPVSDDDVKTFYNQSGAQGQQNWPKEVLTDLEPKIREHLKRQRSQEAWQSYLEGLRQRAQVAVKLERPRIQVAPNGPSRGPEQAAITIVEFSDYQCPYCKRAEAVIQQVLERYPQDVRLIFRHYPLESHTRALPAAEAASCAQAQGRFWEFHAKLFETQALEDADLERYASEVGADLAAFKACVAEHRTRAQVQTDLDEANRAGVRGTPAFFINGLVLSGARPLDDFVRIIEQELASVRGTKTKS